MRATAAQNVRVTEPVYHLVLSFHPTGAVDRAEMEGAADRLLGTLGLQEHHVVLVAHAQRPHPHLHLLMRTHLAAATDFTVPAPVADRPILHVAPSEFRGRLQYNLVSADNARLLLGVSEYPSSATDCHGTGRPVNEGLTPIRRGAHDTDVRISGRACSSYAVFWASV